MAYTIKFAPAAERHLKALGRPLQTRIIRRIEKLKDDPRPSGVTKMKGADNIYRIRQGDYRILYTIKDKDLIVLVLKVGARKDVYRVLLKSLVRTKPL